MRLVKKVTTAAAALAVLSVTVIVARNCMHQQSRLQKWSEVVSLTLYDVDALKEGDAHITDDLSKYTVDETTLAMLARNAEPCSREVWKGSFLGIATMKDGRKCRVAFSYYGAFFEVLDWEQTFRFHGPARPRFESLRQQVLEDVFHPARKLRNATRKE